MAYRAFDHLPTIETSTVREVPMYELPGFRGITRLLMFEEFRTLGNDDQRLFKLDVYETMLGL